MDGEFSWLLVGLEFFDSQQRKSNQQIFAEATIMLVGRQLGLKGGSVGLRCLSVAAGEASEALGHVEASEGRLDRNRVS